MSWFTRIANVFRPARAAAEIDEEIQFHIDPRVAELIRTGVPPKEAERRALSPKKIDRSPPRRLRRTICSAQVLI